MSGRDRFAANAALREMIEADELFLAVLGTAVRKTSWCVITRKTNASWISFSAVTAGIKEIKGVMAEAEANFNFAWSVRTPVCR